MPTNEIKKTKSESNSTTKKSDSKKSITKKLIEKSKLKVNPSTTAEKQKLSKAELFKQAEEAVVRKYLTKTQKVTIATLTGVAVATSVVVPLVCNVIKNNNTTIVEPNPFNIAIYTNYTDSESGQEVFNIKPGTKVSELKPIVKEGYIFKGYFMDEECKIAYDPNHILKENDKIYALLEAEPIVEFETCINLLENEITFNIDTSMTIEEVESKFWKILAQGFGVSEGNEEMFKTAFIESNKEDNGLNYIGLCCDELGTLFPAGYKMKTTDTKIYVGFVVETCRVSIPMGEGYVITDTEGNPITSIENVPFGEIVQFKVRLKDGYFGANEVKVGNTTLTATNEVYSFEVDRENEISVSETYLIAGQYYLNFGSSTKVMYFSEGHTLANSLEIYGYTEENTIGFYSDAEFKNYIDISSMEATEDITIYTTYGWKISDGVLMNADKSVRSGITDFIIPSRVSSIGDEAFKGCINLTNITIPEGLTSIGGNVFYGCKKLTSITISKSLINIADNAFNNCTILSLVIENQYILDNYKLSGNTALTNVVLGDEITSIKSRTFEKCSFLSTITISSSVTSIGYRAFYSCNSLTNVIFEEGSQLTTIYEEAFLSCGSLTSIIIPESVTSIYERIFKNCTKLISVEFKDPDVWYVTPTKTLDLSDANQNAIYLDDYRSYRWKKDNPEGSGVFSTDLM